MICLNIAKFQVIVGQHNTNVVNQVSEPAVMAGVQVQAFYFPGKPTWCRKDFDRIVPPQPQKELDLQLVSKINSIQGSIQGYQVSPVAQQ